MQIKRTWLHPSSALVWNTRHSWKLKHWQSTLGKIDAKSKLLTNVMSLACSKLVNRIILFTSENFFNIARQTKHQAFITRHITGLEQNSWGKVKEMIKLWKHQDSNKGFARKDKLNRIIFLLVGCCCCYSGSNCWVHQNAFNDEKLHRLNSTVIAPKVNIYGHRQASGGFQGLKVALLWITYPKWNDF